MQGPFRPAAPRRRVNSTTVFVGVLAIIALLVGGLFTSEALEHQRTVSSAIERAERAGDDLKAVRFDQNGNVAPADRIRYADAMAEVKSSTGHIATMRGIARTEWMIAAGCFLATIGLGFVALRGTKATTPSVPTASRVVTL